MDSIYNELANPTNKKQRKNIVQNTIDKHWKIRINILAEKKTSLKYLVGTKWDYDSIKYIKNTLHNNKKCLVKMRLLRTLGINVHVHPYCACVFLTDSKTISAIVYEGLRSQTMVWLRKLKFVEMRMCRQ